MLDGLMPDSFFAANSGLPEFPVEWGRPQLGNLRDIHFCVVEMDYRIISSPNHQYDTRKEGSVAVVDLHGVDSEGHSILCHCHGFLPYFYSSIPSDFTADSIKGFQNSMNGAVNDNKNSNVPVVQNVEIVEKRSIMGFTKEKSRRFLKITTQLPKQVATCRTSLEGGSVYIQGVGNFAFSTYESNVDFIIRFMCDNHITGCSWVSIDDGKFSVRPVKDRVSYSQIEIDCYYQSVIPHPPDGEWMKMPPVRILSFDIEVGGAPDHFPTADKDPVIQICAYMQVQGEPEPRFSVAFVLDTCTPIVGTGLYQFQKESDLLLAFQKFIQYVDPDVITGYNILHFDWPYLVERANAIQIPQFCELGRYIKEMSISKEVSKSTKQLGTREGKEIAISGRVQYDMLVAILNDHKLRSYSLNAVSAHFLGDQKEDVHFSMISKLQHGTPNDRHRLAVYCVKDSYLPLQLMNKLLYMVTYVELARVCKVPINYLLNRGQQIRVFSQLLNKSYERGMIIPAVKSSKSDDQFQGATVIEPQTGYYKCPIPTLDFASLYPSIMIAHNLCYSTLLTRPEPGVEYEESPNNEKFVSNNEFPGVLPEILKELLAARKATRQLMEKETDQMRKAVYNKRQLALKISANSVYGFTGATVGKLPCLAISETVTAYGRMMIMKTKELVEQKYTVENGYPDNANVIYGDTDSVMVKFGDISLQQAIDLGKEAAAFVSQFFPPPVHLEFEKAYMPYLLISKKHYAGLLHTNAVKYSYIDAKGIESVRRDNCRLVQNLVQKVLNLLLIDKNSDAAINFVKNVVSDLVSDRIDLSFLVISKTLSKKEDQYKAKQPHVELAERMAKRDPGSAPRMGDRIAYVITDGLKNARAYEKSEDPIYVLEHGLRIDTKYYLENQLEKPLNRLFSPIIGESNIQKLLTGEHANKKKIAPIRDTGKKTGSLLGFVKVMENCICGKSPAQPGKPPVCSNCANRVKEVYQEKMNMMRYAEEEYSKLWTNCQRCQKSLTNPNICTACDCPVFYRRKKAQLDLEDSYKAIRRFNAMKTKPK